jgi:glycosyltransferase involved in cell wall biosynthesis
VKIAVYHNLPSGGAKRTLEELLRRLSRRHEVDVFTLSCGDHDFADLRPSVHAHHVTSFAPLPLLRSPFGRLNQIVRSVDLARLGAAARRIARRIDEGGYDVAFVHPCQFEQSPSVLRHLRSTPSVYYCQEALRLLYESMPPRSYDDAAIGRRRLLNRLDPWPALYRRRLRAIDRANLRSADVVLVNSRFMAGTVRAVYGVEAQVSYLGVDVEHFKPLGVEKRGFVLSVGSLTALKGFDLLIEALACCAPPSRPRLVIVSNFAVEAERAYLTELARHREVELELVGHASEGDLVRLYNEASAVVYAPVREPFGLVPLEALACGTPVVAVAEGGIPESVIDGRFGLLTDRDPVRFGRAVDRLLADSGLARRYGDQGRAHVTREWTWERAAARAEAHLAGAMSRTRAATSPSPPDSRPAVNRPLIEEPRR